MNSCVNYLDGRWRQWRWHSAILRHSYIIIYTQWKPFQVQCFCKCCRKKKKIFFFTSAKVSSSHTHTHKHMYIVHQTTSSPVFSTYKIIISFSLPFDFSLFCDYESGSVFIYCDWNEWKKKRQKHTVSLFAHNRLINVPCRVYNIQSVKLPHSSCIELTR